MKYRFQHTFSIILFALTLCLLSFSGAVADDGVFTLWPLVDYRYSSEADFHSWKFFGPLLKYEKNGAIRQRAFRPFYYRTDNTEEDSFIREVFYPISRKKSTPSEDSYHSLRLWNNYKLYSEDGSDEVLYQQFSLFPLVFYGKESDGERYFAIFPLGGKILNRFWRDEISFFMFPLYSRTERKGTTVRNVLWPIYANIQGENESGTKVWPLWGASEKKGVYKKRFFLWPFFFNYHTKLDTESPEHFRAFFPFYVKKTSPKRSSTYVLWPFFGHVQDNEKGYEEWNYPWPLFRTARGEHKQSKKYLPFYADETVGDYRKRWILWPVYKIEELNTGNLQRRRDRILFFLFSNMEEKHSLEPWRDKKRIAFWPFFTYEKNRGISDFYILSLAEPFFPENEAVKRIWGPLWRVYQYRYDESQDIEVSSFLWNLYWKERHKNDLAWELFPLVRYKREKDHTDLKLLKGLFRYRSSPEKKTLNFLFLPWGINWKTPS